MKKVLHVIPAVAARYGGPSAVVIGACRALRAAGIDTLIATTDADGRGRLRVETGLEVVFDDVPAIFFPRDFSESFKWSSSLGAWLRQHVGDYDLVDVHAIFSHSSIDAGRACRRAGVPYVVRPHGALNPWGLSHKRWRKRVLFRLAVNELLVGAAAVQYTTARERTLAEQAFEWLPRGTVVPPGVDDSLFTEASRTQSYRMPYVLVLSRLARSKRLDELIVAFHRVAGDTTFRDWRLVIGGDGDATDVAMLKRIADSGPAGSRIEFRGWVSGDEKQSLLAGAALLAAPSHQESFGLSLVEAMAHGVPVLTSSDVDLAGEIVNAGAGWIAAEAIGIDDALSLALTSCAELQRRGEAARGFASRFRWSAACRELIDLYEDVWLHHAKTTCDAAMSL